MAATVQFNNINQNKEESVSLSKRLMDLIPRELRMVDSSQGLQKFLLTISMMLVGCLILYLSPWWLMPLGWLFLGTVATGLQAIGYDTASGVFSKSPIVNEVIGHIVTLPLLVPFASWKTQLHGQEYEKLFAKVAQSQFWFFSSLVHWIKSAFVWGRAFRQNRLRVVSSVTLLYAATVLSFGTAFYFGGSWTLAKYWFAPWCVYHFWMTTFITTSYKQREGKTEKVMVVHVRYPHWVELLTHKMNYIMSANRSSLRVPSDNIEKSYTALRAKLDNFMEELSFRSDFWHTVCASASWWLDIARNFNGISAAWICITPLMALYGIMTTEIQAATFRVAVFWYFWAGLGITVGYHRYLAHRSFDAHPIVRWFLLLGGTAAFEGSAIWWCRDHRAHHRFSDTPKDPYGVDRGFFWAHMGWLLLKQDKSKVGKTDCSDLENDPLLKLQEKYYFKLAFLFGLVLPTLVCGLLFGDWRGGFFIAGMVRIVFVMQSTFCINSLAHYVGEQTFSDYRSSRDNFWVSLVTFGEGYHNFHHEFPYDYRNGMVWYAYDPSKWSIWLLSLFGLTYNLKRFPRAEIEKGVIQMQQKRLDQLKARYNWGPEIESLPEYTWQQVRELVREGAALVVYKGLVHDVADFMKIHPGGEKMISCRLGTDITESFNGGVYNHANGARHLLDMFRVGRVKQACDNDSQENPEAIVEDSTLTPRLTRPIPTKQLKDSLETLETKTSRSE